MTDYLCSFYPQLEHYTLAKNLYVSRHYGNDSFNCGSKQVPCRTLARGIKIADQNDCILLDSSFSKSDPYNCETVKCRKRTGKTSSLEAENCTININVSLNFIGFPSAACISCSNLLSFISLSSRNQKTKINFTNIAFSNTSMVFIDSSLSFVRCSFLESFNPVQMKFTLQQSATLAVENCLFFNNTGCIRVELSKSNTQMAIDLTDDVKFTRNRPSSEYEGSAISLYTTLPTICMSNVHISVSCKTTEFSDNVGPLITNNVTFSESNEFYHHVKFIKNTIPLNALFGKSLYFSKARKATVVFDHLISTGNANVRCLQFDSGAVQLKVFNSKINDHTLEANHSGAGILIQGTKSSHVLIKESSFKGNTAGSVGGAVALHTGSGIINLTVCKSDFTNNVATNGGAFLIRSQCGFVSIDLEHANFFKCRAKHTGGALAIIDHRVLRFRARFCRWDSCSAQVGSSIYIASSTTTNISRNTTAIVEHCTFIKNRDVSKGSFFVLSNFGSIQVFQTKWSKSSRGVTVVCDCSVSFTRVDMTGCTGTAFEALSSGERSKGTMILRFERCLFLRNKNATIHVLTGSQNFHLTVESTKISQKKKVTEPRNEYSALLVKVYQPVVRGSKIVLRNVTVEDFTGSASVIFKFRNNGTTNRIYISNCTFRRIRSYYSEKYHTEASPLSIVMPQDDLNSNICSRSHLSYKYRNTIVIEKTSFVDNVGRMSGGVYLVNGNVTIRSCTFERNFAINSGGHVRIADGSGDVKIENTTFKQKSHEMVFMSETIVHDTSIYSESTGQLILQNTLVSTDQEKDSYRLFSETKAGIVKFEKSTQLQCAVGSALRLDNFSHFILWPFSRSPCKLKVTVITLSCHECVPGLYSLQRGQITDTLKKQVDSIFNPFCISCPEGANCSRNVEAKPNFWGYLVSNNPPKLQFVHCPPHYCMRKPTTKKNPDLSVYNSCRGNRDGVMCGRCQPGYTETLFSKKCKPTDKCKDHWIWFLMATYTIVMALFFIHNPPIIQFLVNNTLWFKKASRNRTEYQPLNEPNQHDKGYKKIVFYFYQIASYLTLEPLSEVAKQASLVSFFAGLFNFQTRISREGFGCPFPGITVVTKELMPALTVLATLFNIPAILLLHFLFNKFKGRPHPKTAPYYAATLRTLLLGYATLANTALKLLTCVSVLGESRLYYDANIRCWQWWQYFFVVYVVAFLLPFIAVIYWGAMKLQRGFISVGHFIGACFFPLGFISL